MGFKQCLAEKLFRRADGMDEAVLEDYINRILVLKGLMLGGYTDVERAQELQARLRRAGYMGDECLEDMEEFLFEKISYELLNSDLISRLSFLHTQPRQYCLKIAQDVGIDVEEDGFESLDRVSDGRRSVEERCSRGEFDSII